MNKLIKDLILTASVLSLGTAVVGARQTSAPPVAAAAPTNAIGPKIQFATPLYDFGRMRAGEPVKYTYVFTNTGDALLMINSVQPQCGCTTAGEWTKQVEPGKTGSIPIQFNTAAYNGGVFKQVTVTCNVTNQPTLFLQLKGTVYKPYELIPQMAVLNVPADSDTASATLTITNNVEEPLMLFSAESNNRMFSAELTTNVPGRSYQLKVTAVPPLSSANVQGQINLKASWTNNPVIPVTVVANVQQAIMVMPPNINLPPGPLANATTNSVTIQNNSTNLLQLSEPVVNVPGVEAQIKEMQPGKTFTALVAFPQGFVVTPGQPVELTVKSSNPRSPVIKVPVVQMPRPAAQPVVPAATPPVAAPVAPVTQPPSPAPVAPVKTVKPISSDGAPLPPRPPRPPLPPGVSK